ncbi:rRNA-binding ribosome biosynthesis protein [Tieghemiomyces parasiticus]|uniref:rRNA-binding ribosome biosynthesis protein n=1 Tax=Tieghemiomyces parasiticus TaxID=78921 RepID=A0A9W8A176_9FUNG|nr:rRNA-binding ribosome biosynthesis protein [Tieghemiomyces parasiticus]
MAKKRSAKSRKLRQENRAKAETDFANSRHIPKSFVIRSGTVGRAVSALTLNFRKIMSPFTAVKLKERKFNKLKDFVSIASEYQVTHLMIFSRTETGTNFRVTRLPQGPTLTFRVNTYSLMRDVIKIVKNAPPPGLEYQTAPLLILNNFDESQKHVKLMATTFRNMFPPIQVRTIKFGEARRVVLFNYNAETDRVDFRHYIITLKDAGLSKSIKQLTGKKMPSMANVEDISDYVLKEAFATESDMEDGPESMVTLGEGRDPLNERRSEKRAIRLKEAGPRLELTLTKVQNGMCGGEILYHRFVTKTADEIEAQQTALVHRRAEAARRREEQEANVERKKALADAHREKTREGGLAGMRRKRAAELAARGEASDAPLVGDELVKGSDEEEGDEDDMAEDGPAAADQARRGKRARDQIDLEEEDDDDDISSDEDEWGNMEDIEEDDEAEDEDEE